MARAAHSEWPYAIASPPGLGNGRLRTERSTFHPDRTAIATSHPRACAEFDCSNYKVSPGSPCRYRAGPLCVDVRGQLFAAIAQPHVSPGKPRTLATHGSDRMDRHAGG